jgi:hypothetical protein
VGSYLLESLAGFLSASLLARPVRIREDFLLLGFILGLAVGTSALSERLLFG